MGQVSEPCMFIVLNGPLGTGKSTLAEALSENIDQCVMLDGDHLIAANPPPVHRLRLLHSTISLLVAHHVADIQRVVSTAEDVCERHSTTMPSS